MNHSDQDRNAYMLCGSMAKQGYLRWWHSFVGIHTVTGASRTFFVEYLILNPAWKRPGRGKSPRFSYVRISAGFFPTDTSDGLKLQAYYPISAAKYAPKPFVLQVEDHFLGENRLSGFVDITPAESDQTLIVSDAGTMEWDLELNKTLSCHTGLLSSPFATALNVLDTFWHGEGIRTEYRGTVDCNGERFEVQPDTCSGYADKHWGRSFPSPWLQLASCRLYSERTERYLKHSALALDGCCPRFLFFRLKPRVLLQLTYTGEDYCYSFSTPLHPCRIKWNAKTGGREARWRVMAQNRDSVLKLSIHAPKATMMSLQYDDPADEIGSPSKMSAVRASGEGYGTLDLYRITPEGKKWVDTLIIQDALCIYQRSKTKRSAAK